FQILVAGKEQRLSFDIFSLTEQTGSKQAPTIEHPPVVWSIRIPECQGLTGDWFSLDELFLGNQGARQFGDRINCAQIIITQKLPSYRNPLALHGFRLNQLAFEAEHSGQVVERGGNVRMLVAK